MPLLSKANGWIELSVPGETMRLTPVFRDERYWTLELSDGRPVSLDSVVQALARPEVTLRVHDPSAETEVGSPVRFLFRGVTKVGTYV